MASKTSISNMALFNLGLDRVLDIDVDTHKRAIIVRQFYDSILDVVLAAFPWGFAGKRVTLTQSSVTPDHGYAYKYALPSDYIKRRKVKDDPKYLIEGDFVLTDEETFSLSYTCRVTDTSKYTHSFITLFAVRLSATIAIPLTGKKTWHESMTEEYRALEIEMFDIESRESDEQETDESDDLIYV